MRSCATRSTNLNGPEQTGLAPNFSPAACAALGETIMPARSASCASSGENGADRLSRTVDRVDHVDARHRRELAAAVRARHGLVALDVELDRRGVELLAVVEGHAGAQLERQRLVVGRPLVAGRELRHDLQLLVDVEQLVAQRREDDAADEGARQRRVEHVGILGEADAQGLRLRRERRRRPSSKRRRGDGRRRVMGTPEAQSMVREWAANQRARPGLARRGRRRCAPRSRRGRSGRRRRGGRAGRRRRAGSARG